MLFDSTVRRELARGFGATLVVILTIVLTSMLIRTIGQAANGLVAPQDVVLLLGYIALQYLPIILALSLFIAIVVGLGRMYRDSEMAIWFASGVGLTRFVRPVLRMSWPVLLVVALMLLFVWPWTQRNIFDLRDRYAQRSDLARVAPGVFQTSSDGRRVFFVERESADGVNARNVFILSRQERGESITSARSGRLENVGTDRFLLLEHGQRNDTDASTQERTVAHFEGYRVLAGERAVQEAEVRPPRALPTLELVLKPTAPNQGELVWRLGLLLATGNLVLLGVGLSNVNPRRATNWNLLFAFVVYYNLVNLSQAWVGAGRFGLAGILVVMHGGATLVALGLIWWRVHGCVTTLWAGWRQPRQVAA
jgi:lipopolysaccharide export system permease protein